MKEKKILAAVKLQNAYDEDPNLTPLELALKAGVSVQTAKSFLKKTDIKIQPLEKNTNEIFYVPCGSDKPGHFQADIMYMTDFKSQNKQFTCVLTILETTTRCPYARGLKSAKAPHVLAAIEEMITEIKADKKKIYYMRVDGGPEFKSEFNKLMRDNKIEVETMEPYLSSALNRTNRLHRSLRGVFAEYFARNKNNHWIEYLPKIMKELRTTPSYAFRDTLRDENHFEKCDKHGAMGRIPSITESKTRGAYHPIAPIDITDKQKIKINNYEKQQAFNAINTSMSLLKNGDHVRLLMSHTKESKKESKFGKKSMTQTWTTKIYKIKYHGPNTWDIYNLDNGTRPTDEIKIWQTYNLKRVSGENVEKQAAENDSGKKANLVNRKAVNAARMQALEISIPEQKANLKAPTRARRTGIATRSKRINYKLMNEGIAQ